ncbi:hypothetical protein O1Q56_01665 [Metamycoplasma hominis]|nr:hypothetical protein [Metamycoplasma hominis]MCZ2781491.1 hypothetical protein [Metamycoplasma hominis]
MTMEINLFAIMDGEDSQVIVSSSLSGELFLSGMKPNGKFYKTREHFIKKGIKYLGKDFK